LTHKLPLLYYYVLRPVSGGLTAGEGSEKIRCNNNPYKVFTSATANAANVALPTECGQYTDGASYSLSGLLVQIY
jgi:hypothetical protein